MGRFRHNHYVVTGRRDSLLVRVRVKGWMTKPWGSQATNAFFPARTLTSSHQAMTSGATVEISVADGTV